MLRRLREFATALLGLLVFQLSPLGATAACLAPVTPGIVVEATTGVGDPGASHGREGAPGQEGAHGQGAHDLHGRGLDGASQQPRPSDDGAAPRHHEGQKHCPASMTCAIVAVAAVSGGLPEGGPRAVARIAAPDSAAPASVVGAPEPPPPRA